jgi:hypothetical protein
MYGRWTITAILGAAKALFRQANLLAKSLQPQIAAKQGKFRICESPSYPDRPQHGHAIQSFERAVLVAQTGKDQSLLERAIIGRCQFLGFLAVASPTQGVAEIGPIETHGACAKELDGLIDSPLAQPDPAQTPDAVRRLLAMSGRLVVSPCRNHYVSQKAMDLWRERIAFLSNPQLMERLLNPA